jgi:hypothetical protein
MRKNDTYSMHTNKTSLVSIEEMLQTKELNIECEEILNELNTQIKKDEVMLKQRAFENGISEKKYKNMSAPLEAKQIQKKKKKKRKLTFKERGTLIWKKRKERLRNIINILLF